MAKKTEAKKAGAFMGGGAIVGAVIGNGGSIGIAALGTAIGAPWFLVGALGGLAVYGGYKALKGITPSREAVKKRGWITPREAVKSDLSPVFLSYFENFKKKL